MGRKVYVLKDQKTGEVFTSFMLTPLADMVEKDRRTLLNWISNPQIAQRKNYEISIASHLTGKKGKNEDPPGET